MSARKRQKKYRPKTVDRFPTLLLNLGVAEDLVRRFERTARDDQLRLMMGTADSDVFDRVFELLSVGYQLAGLCDDTEKLRVLIDTALAAVLRIEYEMECGLEPFAVDFDDLRDTVPAVLDIIRVSSTRELIEAQAKFLARKKETLAYYRKCAREALADIRSEGFEEDDTSDVDGVSPAEVPDKREGTP